MFKYLDPGSVSLLIVENLYKNQFNWKHVEWEINMQKKLFRINQKGKFKHIFLVCGESHLEDSIIGHFAKMISATFPFNLSPILTPHMSSMAFFLGKLFFSKSDLTLDKLSWTSSPLK